MQIISWNVKSFVSCVMNQANAFVALQAILRTFDLAVIYEVPNSANGDATLATLVNSLSPLPSPYLFFSEPSGGVDNEDDQVAVIWNRITITVANTTAVRKGTNFRRGARTPVYFDVTELANGHTRECCAWHAPAPGGPASDYIAQGWQDILQNAWDDNRNPLTSIVMGDFNSDFADPSVGSKRKAGNFLEKQITRGATTLIPTSSPPANPNPGVLDYRTRNLYDQFYVSDARDVNGVPLLMVNRAGIYDVLNLLVTNAAPLTNAFNNANPYTTAQLAYNFYYPNLSDHLPVALNVTL